MKITNANAPVEHKLNTQQSQEPSNKQKIQEVAKAILEKNKEISFECNPEIMHKMTIYYEHKKYGCQSEKPTTWSRLTQESAINFAAFFLSMQQKDYDSATHLYLENDRVIWSSLFLDCLLKKHSDAEKLLEEISSLDPHMKKHILQLMMASLMKDSYLFTQTSETYTPETFQACLKRFPKCKSSEVTELLSQVTTWKGLAKVCLENDRKNVEAQEVLSKGLSQVSTLDELIKFCMNERLNSSKSDQVQEMFSLISNDELEGTWAPYEIKELLLKVSAEKSLGKVCLEHYKSTTEINDLIQIVSNWFSNFFLIKVLKEMEERRRLKEV